MVLNRSVVRVQSFIIRYHILIIMIAQPLLDKWVPEVSVWLIKFILQVIAWLLL